MIVRAAAQQFRIAQEWTFVIVGVLVAVNIDRLKGMKVHGIGTESPRTAKIVGIKDLLRQRHPSAGRSAKEYARPRFADAAKAPLDLGIYLRRQRIAVGPHVGGVHAVRI